jgi:hypothetical protein
VPPYALYCIKAAYYLQKEIFLPIKTSATFKKRGLYLTEEVKEKSLKSLPLIWKRRRKYEK